MVVLGILHSTCHFSLIALVVKDYWPKDMDCWDTARLFWEGWIQGRFQGPGCIPQLDVECAVLALLVIARHLADAKIEDATKCS